MKAIKITSWILLIVTLVVIRFLLIGTLAATEDTEKLKKDYLVSGIHQKGLDYFNQKKWNLARFNFEKAYELNPQNEVVRQNLLAVYGELARADAEKENWTGVEVILRKADGVIKSGKDEERFWLMRRGLLQTISTKERTPLIKTLIEFADKKTIPEDSRRGVSIDFHNLAVSFYKKKNFSDALPLAKKSVEIYPSYEACSFLGDLYYQNQRLPEAKAAWIQAVEIRRTPVIREKLARLTEEMPLEEPLEEFQTENFIVKWNKKEWEKERESLRAVLREAYRQLAEDFNFKPVKKIVVIFYDPQNFFQLNRAPHWAGGFYDGKLRLPFGVGYWEKQYQKIVYHELTHAFIYEITKGKCPVWLNEGLAQIEENRVEPISLTIFLAAKKVGALFSLESLNQRPELLREPIDVALFYQESYLLVRYLLEKYGWGEIDQLLKKSGEGKAFSQSFFEMTGKNFKQFEIEWLASFKRK